MFDTADSGATTTNQTIFHAPFPVFLTVQLRDHWFKWTYLRAVQRAGMDIGMRAHDIVYSSGFTLSKLPYRQELVLVTPGDLGFTGEELTYDEFCVLLRRRGLRELLPETVLAARLAYKDQPRGTSVILAAGPFSTPNIGSCLLDLTHSDGGPSMYCVRPVLYRDTRVLCEQPRSIYKQRSWET